MVTGPRMQDCRPCQMQDCKAHALCWSQCLHCFDCPYAHQLQSACMRQVCAHSLRPSLPRPHSSALRLLQHDTHAGTVSMQDKPSTKAQRSTAVHAWCVAVWQSCDKLCLASILQAAHACHHFKLSCKGYGRCFVTCEARAPICMPSKVPCPCSACCALSCQGAQYAHTINTMCCT